MIWDNIVDYIVKRITDYDAKILKYILESGLEISKIYGDKFNWLNFKINQVLKEHYVWLCLDSKEELKGIMIATLSPCFWDPSLKMLRQELIYTSNPIATAELIRYFIDFGRNNANHVIMCIGEKTNIKESSLNKLGFDKLECALS